MAEKDKVIKSGQITLPRLLMLGVVGGIVVLAVYAGGVYLTIGYWLLTLGICVLLYLIAIDYGVKLDQVELRGAQSPATLGAAAPSSVVVAAPSPAPASAPRTKRKGGRPAKRRR
jgi:hypothetical protein